MMPPHQHPGRCPPRWSDTACRAYVDIWFAIHKNSSTAQHRADERLKTICHTCPRELECREWAVTTFEEFWVWGGTTPKERRHIRNQRRYAA